MMVMKNYTFILSAALTLLALASCNKETELIPEEEITPEVIVEQTGSIPFQIKANLNGESSTDTNTKTTLSASTWATTWDDDDIIYAVATDATAESNPLWGSGTASTDSEADNVVEFSKDGAVFSTTTAISDGSHTFNLIYSGNSQKKYHRATATTNSLANTQTFDASDPMANIHKYDALVGQVTKTTPASLAEVSFSHLYTLMKVTLQNETTSAINVSKFAITCTGANIAGVFSVDFSAPSVSLSASGKETVTVNVSNGNVGAKGSGSNTLPIYFVMAPLSGFKGNITFTVTDDSDNTYSRTNTISSPGISFAAGTYNTATFKLTPPEEKEYSRVTSLSDLEDGGKYMIVGEQTATSYGVFSYLTPDSNKRIAYTSGYSSLPTTITTSDATKIWVLGVSGTGESRTVTIKNSSTLNYLNAASGLSWSSSTSTSFTVTATNNMFTFTTPTSTYFGPNKGSNYWRDYTSGTLTQTNAIALYKEWETSALSSIAVSTLPTTTFYVGQSFDYSGLVVTATYANTKTRTVVPTSVSTPDLSVAGTGKVVTVTYTENGVTRTTTYTVDVLNPTQVGTPSITVSSKSHNNIVFSWDAVDHATGYQISLNDNAHYGETQAATTYTWSGLSASTSYTIYVKAIGNGADYADSDETYLTETTNAAVALTSIEITTPPTTTLFKVGGDYSFAGAVVTATYSDASTADVTESCTTDGSTQMSTAGTKTVTVTYTEGGVTKTDTYTMYVKVMYTLDTAAIIAKNEKWATYASGSKTFTASDGSEWVAYNTYRSSNNQSNIQLNNNNTNGSSGYVATPDVGAGHRISKIIITQTGDKALYIKSGDGDTTIGNLIDSATTTAGYTITGDYTQLRISGPTTSGNTVYITSVTVIVD